MQNLRLFRCSGFRCKKKYCNLCFLAISFKKYSYCCCIVVSISDLHLICNWRLRNIFLPLFLSLSLSVWLCFALGCKQMAQLPKYGFVQAHATLMSLVLSSRCQYVLHFRLFGQCFTQDNACSQFFFQGSSQNFLHQFFKQSKQFFFSASDSRAVVSGRFCWDVVSHRAAPEIFGDQSRLPRITRAVSSEASSKTMAGRILIIFEGTRGDLQPVVIAARALIDGGVVQRDFSLGTE